MSYEMYYEMYYVLINIFLVILLIFKHVGGNDYRIILILFM